MTNNSPAICSKWNQENALFYTRISGLVGFAEVKKWETEMLKESQSIPKDTQFKFLVDERNYEFKDMEVHKFKRDVMPKFLAAFGFKLSVLSAEDKKVLDETVTINDKNIQCIAVVMVHHDEEKMQAIDDEFGQNNEKYLSNIETAENWLKNFTNE